MSPFGTGPIGVWIWARLSVLPWGRGGQRGRVIGDFRAAAEPERWDLEYSRRLGPGPLLHLHQFITAMCGGTGSSRPCQGSTGGRSKLGQSGVWGVCGVPCPSWKSLRDRIWGTQFIGPRDLRKHPSLWRRPLGTPCPPPSPATSMEITLLESPEKI